MLFLDVHFVMHLRAVRSWSAAANNVARWRVIFTPFSFIHSCRICNFDVFESDMMGVPVDVHVQRGQTNKNHTRSVSDMLYGDINLGLNHATKLEFLQHTCSCNPPVSALRVICACGGRRQGVGKGGQERGVRVRLFTLEGLSGPC